MPGLKGEEDTNQLPTIAIIASYDTFGAAPVSSTNRICWHFSMHHCHPFIVVMFIVVRHCPWGVIVMEVELLLS